MGSANRAEIISALQKEILHLQGIKTIGSASVYAGLGLVKLAFPNNSFPLGAVHEFISTGKECTASTTGFMVGLLSTLMPAHGTCFWISSSRKLFPPALKSFGIQPDRFVFIDLKRERDMMWAVNEALKCSALTAVIGELREINFTNSRRLQLAVEESQVTGFVLRENPRNLNTTACVSRWRISSLPSQSVGNLPGIGFPQWKVELLKIRNGRPGEWKIRWEDGKFLTSPYTADDERDLNTAMNTKTG